MKKRILIKISGVAIKGQNNNIFDNKKLFALCKQIITLNKIANVAVVIGGGNIWRGNMVKNNEFRRASADYMGMLSTIMNGVAIKEVLYKLNTKAEIYSALNVEKITLPIIHNRINNDFAENKVIIFTGGTGHPFFTTDTACAIRAIDMNANIILMGKSGIDGVYSDDPNKNKNVKFYKSITFLDAINKQLKVMDLSALTLCMENNIDIYVFDIGKKNCIINAYRKQGKYTYIHK